MNLQPISLTKRFRLLVGRDLYHWFELSVVKNAKQIEVRVCVLTVVVGVEKDRKTLAIGVFSVRQVGISRSP